ncbi:hypothetical protein Aple_094600 [Acrocarpospora pleiomorpha]|uniref:Uncharacterized protein n=1 Tax=Acrocarpospora pleiomorpha TaxID=90975 RepID=A0A5M3Y3Y3_9ACTN|nr:hypothetical protein Aple_094600 [Acrocarpospora pleiomorpha]
MGLGLLDAGVAGLAVHAGVEFGAAGEEEGVEAAEVVLGAGGAEGREQHRQSARLLHRARVRLRGEHRLPHPGAPAGGLQIGGDANERTGHGVLQRVLRDG